ncbi:MAG: EamA family transporter [Armatimonadota bacterium]|nr:EamA family transporter [Armatimonadota bacterium]
MVGYLMVLAAAALWGSLGIAVRFLDAAGVGAFEASAWRAGLACAGAVALAWARGRSVRITARDLPLFAAYGLVSIAIFFVTYFTAITLTTVATAAILLYTAPAWVIALSAILFGEDLSGPKLAALALAFVGCALVVRVYDPAALRLNLPGVAAGLGAGLTYGLYSIFGKHALRRHDPLVILVYALGFGTIFLVAGGLLAGVPAGRFVPAHVLRAPLALLYLALITTLAAQWLYVGGLARIEAGRASVVATFEPVVAGLLGYVFFGEVLDRPQLLGGVLVLSAVFLVRSQAVAGRTVRR